jgi:hypothetical protein
VKDDPSKTPLWQSIIGQYRPTFLSQCENAIAHSNSFVRQQLECVMFHGEADAKIKSARIVKNLAHYTQNKTHDRHIHAEDLGKMGLNIKLIEDAVDGAGLKDAAFQDLILTVHHCYMHTLMNTPTYKIIENHLGTGMTKNHVQPAAPRSNSPQADS